MRHEQSRPPVIPPWVARQRLGSPRRGGRGGTWAGGRVRYRRVADCAGVRAARVQVPPVPVVAAVRVAQHPECGYDRLVLDLTGPVPSYDVRYVSRVMADASGKTITMPGHRYLLITLKPAQGHTAAGVPTVARQVQLPGYPALQSWVLAGDFEGVVRIAIGLPGKVGIRTGELAGRIYVDVRSSDG